MIIIKCDICGKECRDPDFMFEAEVIEVKTAIDSKSLSQSKQAVKKMIQLCCDCYKKKIEPLLQKD